MENEEFLQVFNIKVAKSFSNNGVGRIALFFFLRRQVVNNE